MAFSRSLIPAFAIVGEGRAERVFLEHLKSLYAPRGCGVTYKIIEASGKGGRGVLDYTISRTHGLGYDEVYALLDTDTDWDDEQRARARKNKIHVIESEPCIEAWLLAVYNDNAKRTSAKHKAEFERRFGGPSTDRRIFERHFSRQILDEARDRVLPLNKLLTLLGA